MRIPDSERLRFESLIVGQSRRFGLTPDEYLRKVWYHEQASRLGEYVAMTLLDELLPLIITTASSDTVEDDEMAEVKGR